MPTYTSRRSGIDLRTLFPPTKATRNTRNAHGVKESSDCYRTFSDGRYDCWMSCPSDERIAAYRAAGIRCKRRGEELFVHQMDTDMATKIDRQLDP